MSADTFGEWIKQRRKHLDITQMILAQRVGCSLSAIRKIENDERRPSLQIADLLAHYLEVPSQKKPMFLKAARGIGSIHHLGSAATATEKPVAVSEYFHIPANIPSSTSPFIGRQQESESLSRMLSNPHQRLITIVGPGGVGKTRLAIQAASAQLETFQNHIYFTQLAAFNSVDSILPAIASTLNIPSTTADEQKTRLVGYLRNKKFLLVLDNFEHLIDGAPLLSEILQQAPHLKLMVTSRERLNLHGEWTFELGGLTIPPPVDQGKAVYSALQLFEIHAQRIRPDFQLTSAEREAAIRICQRVDGLPLAIELAAAWVNVFSCQEIANEIEQGFDFLSSTLRDAPERHRSLRATFEHSWKRLSPPEKEALSGLTIFQGGFTPEAAASIVGADRSVLSSLVSKSLLHRTSSRRFDLHEVIRQYARDYLKNEPALLNRHSEYYLGRLHESEAELFGADASNLLSQWFDELGNLPAAWERALGQKSFASMSAALESLWMLCDVHGWLSDGIEQTEALIEALRAGAAWQEGQIFLGRALTFHGMLLFRAGDYPKARLALEEGIRILRAAAETKFLPPALIFCGIVVSLMGDFPRAREMVDEGVQYAQEHHNRWFMALGQFDQGFILGQEGKLENAYERMQSGLRLWRELGNTRFIAFALNFLSPIAIQLGRLEDAHAYLEESLELSTQISDRWGMGTALGRLGSLALIQNDLIDARTRLEKSLSLFTDLGTRWDIAWALTNLGQVAIASEGWLEAERLLKQAIQLSIEAQAMPQTIDAALELADCFVHQGKVYAAMALILPVLQHPASTNVARQRAGDLKAVVEHQISSSDRERLPEAEALMDVLERFLT